MNNNVNQEVVVVKQSTKIQRLIWYVVGVVLGLVITGTYIIAGLVVVGLSILAILGEFLAFAWAVIKTPVVISGKTVRGLRAIKINLVRKSLKRMKTKSVEKQMLSYGLDCLEKGINGYTKSEEISAKEAKLEKLLSK